MKHRVYLRELFVCILHEQISQRKRFILSWKVGEKSGKMNSAE